MINPKLSVVIISTVAIATVSFGCASEQTNSSSTAIKTESTPTPTSANNSPTSKIDTQSSQTTIDYTRLKKLLSAKDWQEAHQETRDLMIQAGGREEDGYLNKESIENFPCQDLNTIDQLWSKYSNGKFGFNTQRQIWENMGGNPSSRDSTLAKLAVQVGWKQENADKNEFLEYSELTFEPQVAVNGHLPALRFIPSIFNAENPGFASLGLFPQFMYRVRTCSKQ